MKFERIQKLAWMVLAITEARRNLKWLAIWDLRYDIYRKPTKVYDMCHQLTTSPYV